jgi:predicted nucleotidyltransferase
VARTAPPLPDTVRETLDAYVAGLRQRFGARLRDVRLFGSWARGEGHAESDVDVLVLLDGPASREDSIACTDLAADLVWQLHGEVVSPLVMSAGEFDSWKATERRTPLEIERDGVSL